MYGYDSPEMKPPLTTPHRAAIIAQAIIAKNVLSGLVLGKLVNLECFHFDKYGRILANLWSIEPVEINWRMTPNVLINEYMRRNSPLKT